MKVLIKEAVTPGRAPGTGRKDGGLSVAWQHTGM